jgi:DNA-binding MarR family transcriptional regulator
VHRTESHLLEPLPVEDALGYELVRHARLLNVLRSQLSSVAPVGLDYAAFALLMTLNKCGAKRQGELADLALLDPSTVSRHIGQLVRAGLVERRADPDDGRAVQLLATAAGVQVGRELLERRQHVIREVTSEWDDESKRTLFLLLRRLNDDLEAHRALQLPPIALHPTTDPAQPTDQES